MSQNSHLMKVWMSGSFVDQRWGQVSKQSKKAINLANISEWQASAKECFHFFLHQSVDRVLNFTSQAEGQDSLKQDIMYDFCQSPAPVDPG